MISENPEANVFGQHDILKSVLNQEGFRLTHQRQKILELFDASSQGEHLTAEEIYLQLSSQGEKISFSTIYRTLHVMVNLGILRELELSEGKKYYEPNDPFINQHHHLVCVQCGALSEFEDKRVTGVSQKETRSRGFSLLSCQFTVYGICPTCQTPY